MTTSKQQPPPLGLCFLLDFIGYASFSLPFLGEITDILWAPLSGILFFKMFGGKMGVSGGGFAFLEELLFFTDFIPTFTVAWAIKYFSNREQVSDNETIVAQNQAGFFLN